MLLTQGWKAKPAMKSMVMVIQSKVTGDKKGITLQEVMHWMEIGHKPKNQSVKYIKRKDGYRRHDRLLQSYWVAQCIWPACTKVKHIYPVNGTKHIREKWKYINNILMVKTIWWHEALSKKDRLQLQTKYIKSHCNTALGKCETMNIPAFPHFVLHIARGKLSSCRWLRYMCSPEPGTIYHIAVIDIM